jgi:hypothetical protein
LKHKNRDIRKIKKTQHQTHQFDHKGDEVFKKIRGKKRKLRLPGGLKLRLTPNLTKLEFFRALP